MKTPSLTIINLVKKSCSKAIITICLLYTPYAFALPYFNINANLFEKTNSLNTMCHINQLQNKKLIKRSRSNGEIEQIFNKELKGLKFSENKGQITDQNYAPRPDVLFSANDENLAFHFKKNGLSYQLIKTTEVSKSENYTNKKVLLQQSSYRIDISWLNSSSLVTIETKDVLPGKNNYYSQLFPNGTEAIFDYKQIIYHQLYDGIDLRWYEKNNHLKYDYIINAGVDYKKIKLKIEGSEKIVINAKGELVIETPYGKLIEEAPIVFQNHKVLKSNWIIKQNVIEFNIENLNPNMPYIIDPCVRAWGTYYGGNGAETQSDCITDGAGNVYLSGRSYSGANIATVGSHQQVYGNNADAFLVKFNGAGVRQWATYYGGNGYEEANSVALDQLGNIYICGTTEFNTAAIATAGAHQVIYGGGNRDAFLAKFNNLGVRQWGTYYGGSGQDEGYSCSTDLLGNVYISGQTNSNNAIATALSHQTIFGGSTDGFLVKFNAAGTRQWGTYYGGNALDFGTCCYNDPINGDIILSGYTASQNGTSISTLGSHQSGFGGSTWDCFLVKFNNLGVRQWGTYYGGIGNDLVSYNSSCIDSQGNIYLTGYTDTNAGNSIATATGFQSVYGGGATDIFLVQFNSAGTRQWATYYGDTGDDTYPACSTDACDNIYFTGYTSSIAGIATAGSHQTALGGGIYNALLAKFTNNGGIIWATYYGGNLLDIGSACCVDINKNIYLAGQSMTAGGTSIATLGSHQPNHGGGSWDCFLAKFIPVTPTITPTQTNPSACSCNGSLSVSISNGEPPYNYYWNTGVSVLNTTLSSNSITGLCPGVYQVTVVSNCNYTTITSYTLTGLATTLTTNFTTSNTACNSTTGSLTINSVINGNPNYILTEGTTTLVSNFNTPYTLNGIAIGSHTYVLTDLNGCNTTFTINIQTGSTVPTLTVSTPVTLNCSPNNATLTANSSATSVTTYNWAGPGIISGANTQSVTVNQIGNYTVTINNAGCTNSSVIAVVANTTAPNISINNPGTLTCLNTTLLAIGSSTSANVTYSWSPLNVVTNTVIIGAVGIYTLEVTDVFTGCKATGTININQNILTPSISVASSGILTCSNTSILLSGISTATNLNYNWSPQSVTTQTSLINAPGNYTLTVTDLNNGCSNTQSISVMQNTITPTLSINPASVLTCTNISVILSATSSSNTILWNGGLLPINSPNASTVNIAGNYTATAIDPINGCATTQTVSVNQNTLTPTLTINPITILNCTNTSVVLSATSTSNIIFWNGVGLNNATNPTTVNTAGNYVATSTNSLNGCAITQTIAVLQNTLQPNANAGSTQSITCAITSATLNGSSTTPGVTFSWNPTGVTTSTNIVNAAGNYTLLVSDPINGCSNTATTSVVPNGAFPSLSITTTGNLTCANQSVTLTGSSNTPGVTYSWSPQNVTSQTIMATMAGNYTLSVINSTNGCASNTVITVNQNTTSPTLTINPINILDCNTTSVTLTAVSIGNTIFWNSSNLNNVTNPATVNIAGSYTATALNPINGCTTTQTITINQNTITPALTINPTTLLNCTTTSVVLNATSIGNTILWNGGSLNNASNPTTVNIAGNYVATSTNSLNGCATSQTIAVLQNTLQPNANAGLTQSITCTIPSATLNGSSTTPGVTFSWNPTGVTTNTNLVNAVGNYTLTVTDPINGCMSSATTNVVANGSFPNISIVPFGTLTCLNSSINLLGSSSTNGVSFSWSPQGVNTASAIAISAGNYTFTVTDPLNGCMSSSVITVTQNTTIPSLIINPINNLTCINTSVSLSAASSGNSIVWNSSSLINAANPVLVSVAGTYSATATEPVSGCYTTSIITVSQNTTVPSLSITASATNLNCSTTSVTLIGSSNTVGGIYAWSNNVLGATNITTAVASNAGTYSLSVTDPVNGCFNTATVGVNSVLMFNASVVVLSQINCFGNNNGVLQIGVLSGGTAPFSITNLNTANSINNVSSFPIVLNNLSVGNYSILVSDANGCKQTLFATITQPAALNLSLGGNATLCEGQSTTITSNASGGSAPYAYVWSPNVSNSPNLTISPSANTTFSLTITDNNGCAVQASIAIVVHPKPNATLMNNQLVGCSPVCAGFSLSAIQQQSYIYNWQFVNNQSGSVTASSLYHPDLCFKESGSYNVGVVISSSMGCSTTVTYNNIIQVYKKPIADFSFSPSSITMLEPLVSFTNTSTGANNYEWYNANMLFSNHTDPTHLFQEPGTYLIAMVATNGACSDTALKSIEVEDEFLFYAPNAFTPNDDNLNDTWYPLVTGYKVGSFNLLIFDRWGELLYQSNNPTSIGWDGFYKKELCKDDIYVWKASVKDKKGKLHQFTGHLNLLK